MASINQQRVICMLDSKVPDFSLPATSGQTFSLGNLAGKIVVIYFYPKDSTPGCTTEGSDFRDLHAEFQRPAPFFGISRDSVKSHEDFKAKQNLPFELGSVMLTKPCAIVRCHENEKHVWQEGTRRRTQHLCPRP
jgi:peroxiredoxin